MENEKQNPILDSFELESLKRKQKIAARERFGEYIKFDANNLAELKNSIILLKNKQFGDFYEPIIEIDVLPAVLISDFPYIKKIEDWLKFTGRIKGKQIENFKLLKEYFEKWFIQKNENEKKYFALSILKLIDKEISESNAIKNIISGIIFGFERNIIDLQKSEEKFLRAENEINSSDLESSVKIELLYYIKLLRAASFILAENYEKAKEITLENSNLKINAPTAKYYLAYCESKLHNDDLVILEIFEEILNYDLNRLEISLQSNNFPIFIYLLQNAAIYHFYREGEFSNYISGFENIIEKKISEKSYPVGSLNDIYDILNSEEFIQYHTKEIIASLELVNKFILENKTSKSVFLFFSGEIIYKKLINIAYQLIGSIKNKLIKDIEPKVAIYDTWIKDHEEQIQKYEFERNKELKILNDNYEEKKEQIKNTAEKQIIELENKIQTIDLLPQYNAKLAFQNSMVYGGLLSVLVFIFGGFSGCYGYTIQIGGNFFEMMLASIFTGFKWGFLTLIFSLLISALVAGYASIERSNEKQKLIGSLNLIKTKLDKDLKELDKIYNINKNEINEYYDVRIKQHQEKKQKFIEEKEEKYKEYFELMMKELKIKTDYLIEKLNYPPELIQLLNLSS
jgi:hypothetical protein